MRKNSCITYITDVSPVTHPIVNHRVPHRNKFNHRDRMPLGEIFYGIHGIVFYGKPPTQNPKGIYPIGKIPPYHPVFNFGRVNRHRVQLYPYPVAFPYTVHIYPVIPYSCRNQRFRIYSSGKRIDRNNCIATHEIRYGGNCRTIRFAGQKVYSN